MNLSLWPLMHDLDSALSQHKFKQHQHECLICGCSIVIHIL